MQVVDEQGKVILFRRQQLVKGTNTVSLDLGSLSTGTYFVIVRMGTASVTKKMEVIN